MTLVSTRDDIFHSSEAKGIMAEDPFVTLDEEGVGELMKVAMSRGKATRPDMPMGICGEHGGDPKSIDFCQRPEKS